MIFLDAMLAKITRIAVAIQVMIIELEINPNPESFQFSAKRGSLCPPSAARAGAAVASSASRVSLIVVDRIAVINLAHLIDKLSRAVQALFVKKITKSKLSFWTESLFMLKVF